MVAEFSSVHSSSASIRSSDIAHSQECHFLFVYNLPRSSLSSIAQLCRSARSHRRKVKPRKKRMEPASTDCIILLSTESSHAQPKNTSWQFEVIACGRKLGTSRGNTKKRLSSSSRPKYTGGDVIDTLAESEGSCPTAHQATGASKHHRPADLAVCDSSINRRVGHLLDRINCCW